jgi:hypothetical protein
VSELKRVLGEQVALETIVDCRVTRARAGGLTSVAVGSKPTWLNVMLQDGRELKAHARGPGPEQQAIEAAAAEITAFKVAQAEEALNRGETASFRAIAFTPEGILRGKALTPWAEVAQWAIDEGYLVFVSIQGRKWKLWLGKAAFGDAVCRIVERRLPDRRVDATQLTGSVLAGRVMLAVIAAAVVIPAMAWGVHRAREWQREEEWLKLPRGAQIVDAAAAVLNDAAALATVPVCSPATPEYLTVLAATDKTSIVQLEGTWKKADLTALHPLTRTMIAWAKEGSGVRVLHWDHQAGKAKCTFSRALDPSGDVQRSAEEAASGIAPAAPPQSAAPPAEGAAAADAAAAPPPPLKKAAKKKKTTTTKTKAKPNRQR